MNKLKVIIVEDEPLAADLIRSYISQIAHLSFIKAFHDPKSALDYLKTADIDVIFLDIHLPQMTGLTFIQQLESNPQIILTTAYHQYALESYEYNVVDYLLKPIEFDRFEKAVQKLNKASEKDYITINVNKSKMVIPYNDILYIESQRDYLKIFTENSHNYRTKMTLTSILNELPDYFTRIHRSFIVNNHKVIAYNATKVQLVNHTLPIGRKYQYMC